jgi:hypothetical protein
MAEAGGFLAIVGVRLIPALREETVVQRVWPGLQTGCLGRLKAG